MFLFFFYVQQKYVSSNNFLDQILHCNEYDKSKIISFNIYLGTYSYTYHIHYNLGKIQCLLNPLCLSQQLQKYLRSLYLSQSSFIQVMQVFFYET